MYFYLPGKVDIMIDIFKRYCVDSNAARFLTIYIAERLVKGGFVLGGTRSRFSHQIHRLSTTTGVRNAKMMSSFDKLLLLQGVRILMPIVMFVSA